MADVRISNSAVPSEFLAAHGGPFYELQARLLRDRALRTGQPALIFTGLAWGIPLLLGLPNSLSLDSSAGVTYLTDPAQT